MCKICDKYKKKPYTTSLDWNNYRNFVYGFGGKEYVFKNDFTIVEIDDESNRIIGNSIRISYDNKLGMYINDYTEVIKIVPLYTVY